MLHVSSCTFVLLLLICCSWHRGKEGLLSVNSSNGSCREPQQNTVITRCNLSCQKNARKKARNDHMRLEPFRESELTGSGPTPKILLGPKWLHAKKIVLSNSFLNYIALPYICHRLPGLISGCNVMVSLSCARKGEPQGNLFTLHYPTGGSQRIN